MPQTQLERHTKISIQIIFLDLNVSAPVFIFLLPEDITFLSDTLYRAPDKKGNRDNFGTISHISP